MSDREKLMKLLNDYYGNSRDENHKEEICDFIEGYYEGIKEIMES
jgi:hypothetical protein